MKMCLSVGAKRVPKEVVQHETPGRWHLTDTATMQVVVVRFLDADMDERRDDGLVG